MNAKTQKTAGQTPDDFPGSERDRERQARAIGNDPTKLLARLRDGARMLTRSRDVAQWTFDAAAKTLRSPDGRFCVAWQLRRWQDRPICYENQQTSVGGCYLADPEFAATEGLAR